MPKSGLITPILIGGSLIILISFGIRATFGLFQVPIEAEFGWPRSEFSLAIAIQSLAWGIGQPAFAAFAERFGDRLAIAIGIVVYALGLVLSAYAYTPTHHHLLEVLIGFGIAGTGFGVLIGAIGRATSDEHRSMALAISTAVGAGGQVVGPPVAAKLLETMNWSSVFLIFAAIMMVTFVFLPLIRAPARAPVVETTHSMGEVVAKAIRDPSYTLIFLGFFSCGFHLAFITAHLPAYILEVCGPIEPGGLLDRIGIGSLTTLGGAAIAVIGITNVFGTLMAGWLGKSYPKRYLLAVIYALRTLVIVVFIAYPITPASVLVFSGAMGTLWLATVPLTAAMVGHIYGIRFMGTLYGFVFLSHQIGGFVGVWMGGELYDIYGSYDLVWWVGVGVGAFSAIIHLPIRERPLPALSPTQATPSVA